VRSSTDSKVFTASGFAAGIRNSLARSLHVSHGRQQNGLSVFTLYFRDRSWRASALVWDAPLKFVGDGRVKVATSCIGDLRNIFTAGLIPLMGPDGHLQNLALAVRIGAAFREMFCRRFRLGSNFLRFFAVRHKSPASE
jgi:hypothetical protein